MTGADLAQAAETLIGAPFRLHGRDPAHGLDCVGVVVAAFERAGRQAAAPARYGLRNLHIADALAFVSPAGLVEIDGPIELGDVVLVRPGPGQHHLMIAADSRRFVHAHAGLRRVVATPAPLPWPTIRHWRLEGQS